MRLPLPELDLHWGLSGLQDVADVDVTGHFFPETVGRNYGDVLYEMPDLTALRAVQDFDSALAVLEYGEHLPQPRTLLRRFAGAVAEPLSRVSAALDGLPLQFHPGYVTPDWARWLLGTGGLNVPDDLPLDAARRLLLRSDGLFPLGRPAATLLAAECALGRATLTVTVDDGWQYTRATFQGGAALLIAEHLRESGVDLGGGNRDVQLRLSGAPEWVAALLNSTLGGYFSARVQPWPDPADDLLTNLTLA